MPSIVRHVVARAESGLVRFAVVADPATDRVELRQLSRGKAALTGFGPNGGQTALERARELHRGRLQRYAVESRPHLSGAWDFLLRIEANAALYDYPVVARLHASMHDKFNEGLSCWLGDLAALLEDERVQRVLWTKAEDVEVFDPSERRFAWKEPAGRASDTLAVVEAPQGLFGDLLEVPPAVDEEFEQTS